MWQLENPPMLHSYRETNKVADILAKEGAKLESLNSFILWTIPPLFVIGILETDKARTTFARHDKPNNSTSIYCYLQLTPSTNFSSSTALPVHCNDAHYKKTTKLWRFIYRGLKKPPLRIQFVVFVSIPTK
ncbi:hypothetical protein H5410_060009 [Solanum commersonii]|uniref:Uncharacterized protein n=1 Tax=Solanum commersonii TaxID=4109 RepID=A0A9J5W3X9_SOLCO|nr:hypothetical protein H5410_060009 [Solanum commersonii]